MKDFNLRATLLELLVACLFICGIALIAAGLGQISPALAAIFLGVAILYMAACISKSANSPRKDGKE